MNKHPLKILAPGFLTLAALAMAFNIGAQTPPPSAPPDVKSPPAASTPVHHKDGAAAAKHEADMKAECQALKVRKQEMQDKIQAMDVKLDKLVADMNAVRDSKEVDALEKPMAAVLTEMVAQRKVLQSMVLEMHSAMMEHMARHMGAHGAKGALDCPMMKTDKAVGK
jgi:Skp family chaperone for outer membrane proteins